MKLKELNEAIASACNVRAQVVNAVQAETFRQIQAAREKGEKVAIPDFGFFIMRDIPAEGDEPAKKLVKFKVKNEDAQGKEARTEARKQRRAEAKAGETENSNGSGA